MSDSNTDQQEPSMEEILASIRRIISEDGEEIADGEDAPEPVEADADNVETEPEAVSEPLMDDGDDDILELTDALDDEIEEVSEPEPEPEPNQNPSQNPSRNLSPIRNPSQLPKKSRKSKSLMTMSTMTNWCPMRSRKSALPRCQD